MCNSDEEINGARIDMKLLHAVNTYVSPNKDEQSRNERAMATWRALYSRHPGVFVPAYLEKTIRSSLDIGDSRDLPYVKDVIENAFESGNNQDDDVCIWTNMDSCLVWETVENLFMWFSDHECCYSNRRELDKVPKVQFDQAGLMERSDKSEGVDLVAFTRKWWTEHKDNYPDLFVGSEGLDWIFRFMMEKEARIREVVYHIQHQVPQWYIQRRTSQANLHNRKLCLEWVNARSDRDMIRRAWPGLRDYEKDLKRNRT